MKTAHYPLWLRKILEPIRFKWIRLLGYLPHPNVRKGDRFLALTELQAKGLTHWRAPFTGGFECNVPKGTILVAVHDSAPISTGFGVEPENYEELEKQLVPEEDRTAEKYGGYSFVINYREIGKRVKQVQQIAS